MGAGLAGLSCARALDGAGLDTHPVADPGSFLLVPLFAQAVLQPIGDADGDGDADSDVDVDGDGDGDSDSDAAPAGEVAFWIDNVRIQYSSVGTMTSGRNAISSGERFAQAETNRNQPMNGENQMGSSSMNRNKPAQTSKNGADFQIRNTELPPWKLT